MECFIELVEKMIWSFWSNNYLWNGELSSSKPFKSGRLGWTRWECVAQIQELHIPLWENFLECKYRIGSIDWKLHFLTLNFGEIWYNINRKGIAGKFHGGGMASPNLIWVEESLLSLWKAFFNARNYLLIPHDECYQRAESNHQRQSFVNAHSITPLREKSLLPTILVRLYHMLFGNTEIVDSFRRFFIAWFLLPLWNGRGIFPVITRLA